MLNADPKSYPPASRFRAAVSGTDLLAALRRSNDDPIPRQLAIVIELPAGHPTDIDADVARLYQEVELIAELVDGDRQVIELHCSVGKRQQQFPALQLRDLMVSMQRQLHFSHATEREFEVDAGCSTVTLDDIETLATSGFNRIELNADRLATPIICAARSEGFRSITARIVFGAVRQSNAALLSILDFVLELRPDRLIVPVEPPHGRISSDWPELVRDRLDRAGYIFIGPDCFALPDDDLARALRADRLRYSLPGHALQWDCDLLGLGIGAISQVGDFLIQNTGDLAGWRRAIDAGHFPTERGFRLTADDELRADLVRQLFCRRKIAIDEFERDHGIGFRRYFAAELTRLAPCFATGLVLDRGDRIEVDSRAWPWLRNIARCFYASDNQGRVSPEVRLRH